MTEYPSIPYVPSVPFDMGHDRYIRFGPFFEVFEFTDWIDESMSWKETCYIGDWSPLMKFSVKGPQALEFWSSITINSFSAFDIGQAKHAVLPNSDGKVMGEGILMRLAEDELFFTSGPGAVWAAFKFHSGEWDAEYTDLTGAGTIQQVQSHLLAHQYEALIPFLALRYHIIAPVYIAYQVNIMCPLYHASLILFH